MESSLVDFLNHGILPFVGRTAESERITRFWRTNDESHHLRAMLVAGESGIGKSRLIEEITPRISRSGGAIVHAKLYPESTASIASLLARALRFLNTRRNLLLNEPEENLLSVISALRRISRLRPTLLVLEDIHLLTAEGLRELATLFQAVSDEQLAVLCLARRTELNARPILERYLIDEMALKGLAREEVSTLWITLFGMPAQNETLDQVMAATLGNPLAIRSALRGAVKTGALVHNVITNSWQPLPSAMPFDQVLKRNVQLLSEGLAAHLSPRMKSAAKRLAALGEIFSREAALLMVDDADAMIDALIFRGLVATTGTQVAPLPGRISEEPVLAFTHTLFHNHLAQDAGDSADRLIRVIATEAPLYSALPFQIIAEFPPANASAQEVEAAITRSLDVALELDDSNDWQLGSYPLRAAMSLSACYNGLWTAPEKERLEARILAARLSLLRRAEDHDEYEALVDRFLKLTEEPTPDHLLEYRLTAFTYRHSLGRRKDPSICMETWRASRELVKQRPEARFTIAYVKYLDSAARSMLYMGDEAMLQQIEKELDELASAPNVDERYRHMARYKSAIHFLDIFQTEEELRRRLNLLHELESFSEKRKMSFLIFKISFLVDIGHMDEALATITDALPLFRDQGLSNNYYYGSLSRLCAQAAIGESATVIESEVARLEDEAPKDIADRFRMFARMTMIELGLLRDDRQWLSGAIERCGEHLQHLRPEALVTLALEESVQSDAIHRGAYLARPSFQPLLNIYLSSAPIDTATAHKAAAAALQGPLLRVHDLLEQRASIAVIVDIGTRLQNSTFVASLHGEIATALTRTLNWLKERRLAAYMTPVLERYKHYLKKQAVTRWREQIELIVRERHDSIWRERASARERIRLSMLGSIRFHAPGAEDSSIRGSRLRALLGLMVADHMLDDPLAYREFCHIVTGIDDDPERARRALNGIVYRLREVMGHDVILTVTETPQLNPDRIEVDLLEAFARVQDAKAAIRDEALARAQRALMEAFELMGTATPFPTLEEPFFEALREDFQNEQRSLALSVARGLIAERDPKSAEELLRHAYRTFPDDETIADLLCRALTLIGKRVEAERIRLQGLFTM